jgi:transcription initiation factor TFIID TATA-box-binding protein
MAEFTIRVENVVAYAVLGKQIPLNMLVAKVETAEYRPEQFPGVVYRVSDPSAAALIFSTGKIVCTGAKSIEDAEKAITKVVKKLKDVGVPVPSKFDVEIEEIVAATKIDTELKLKELAFALEGAEYDPEQFPELVYRMKDPAVTLIMFSSGKIICKGARSVDDIYEALNKMKDKLEAIGIAANPVDD